MESAAREIALQYLNIRIRSEEEIKRHLKGKAFSEDEIEETLMFLREAELVDDESYCYAYTESAIAKGKGPVWIEAKLKERGLASALFRACLEECLSAEREKELAIEVGERFLESLPARPEDPNDPAWAKLARRLASRGFRPATIHATLSHYRR